MFHVIDTIRWGLETQHKLASSGVPQLGEGLLVLLDPTQVTTAPMEAGGTVRVHSPDGTVNEWTVASVEVRHAVVGLFFANAKKNEIPLGSEIEVVGAA